MEKMKLESIADIQIGYQHRGKIGRPQSGTHVLIQISDIKRGLDNDLDSFDRINPTGDPDRYTVSKGDVLFLSRGDNPFATCVSEVPENSLASNYFYIVRPHTDKILPEYLAWYINQTPSQKFIESRMRGSNMKMLPISSFRELEIEIPELTTQANIAGLDKLRIKEQQLTSKLADARGRLIQAICLDSLQNQRKPI
jgi:hypothetical protein